MMIRTSTIGITRTPGIGGLTPLTSLAAPRA